MNRKSRKLEFADINAAVIGGTILGGGGGGSFREGQKFAEIAIQKGDVYLVDISELNDEDTIITVSLVGAPSAFDKVIFPEHFERSIKLFERNSDVSIKGIITNENGGGATVNGWLQSVLSGIALIDAPCNGRAHPTGVMGSLGLHKYASYNTTQVAVGGDISKNHYLEYILKGSIEHTSSIVRQASVQAGGVVVVARNPVSTSYVKQNAALGAVSKAIEIGYAYNKGLEHSVIKALDMLSEVLFCDIITKGVVANYTLNMEGGFDIGALSVNDYELTFWNEYMTLEHLGKRQATFPDLIMSLDAQTGIPVTSAELYEGQEIYIITVPMNKLILSTTMYDKELLSSLEPILNKKIIEYLNF